MYTYNLSIDIVSFNFVKCYNIGVLFLKSITTMCVWNSSIVSNKIEL